MNRRCRGWTKLLFVGAAVLLAGCEEDVVAVLGTDRAYTLWGVLNPLADTQFVRVFPIEGTLNAGRPEPLAACFVSLDLETGEEHVWQDSVVVDDRGLVGHIFYAPFQVVYAHRYRLTITGSQGASSFVEVEVPVQADLSLEEPDTTLSVLLPGYIRGTPTHLIQSTVELAVSYVTDFTASGCPVYSHLPLVLAYDDRIQRFEEGWWFLLNLSELYAFVEDQVDRDDDYLRPFGITLQYIRFRTIVANEAWSAPDGLFDPQVLVQPGTMSNVQRGFGFVGSGYRLTQTWTLLAQVVEKSGFRANYADC